MSSPKPMPYSSLRERLRELHPSLYGTFLDLVQNVSPVLQSIEILFPEYTRHDPSHSIKLESISLDLLGANIAEHLTAADLFVLLSALWLHDAGMGVIPELESKQKATPEFQERLASFQRLGMSEQSCWKDYVRQYHHTFCPYIAERYLSGRANPFLVHWIGRIGQSHGERDIHDRKLWPKSVAVGDNLHLHAPLLGVLIRLSDILHLNSDRAPEYMLEHRRIRNVVSIAHWKAHQVISDYTIADDFCYFDGVTGDDEALWFVLQFAKAMDDEVRYCKQDVLSTLDPPFQSAIRFSRVENRIESNGFETRIPAVTLRVETTKILEDLLNNSLYAGQPTWFREILQNAFDACRDRIVLEPASQPSVNIQVHTTTEMIEFADTGTGMTPSVVENYLLVAGASFWDSEEYRSKRDNPAGHVGKFGVGFMSVFAVAEDIELTTRHYSSSLAFRYTIRGVRRVVRVEQSHRANPGTTIRVKLKPGTLLTHDPVELLDSVCSFPEFPLRLVVDSRVERDFEQGVTPSTSTSNIDISPGPKVLTKARLLKRDIATLGIRGDFYLPKIYVNELESYIPDIRGWVRKAGWQFSGESRVYFGGINYPAVHALGGVVGFSHIPSIGLLRLAVSPNEYALEMNLARDQFITGQATVRFHETVCNLLDEFIADDLADELRGKSDDGIRSTIASRHSASMLGLWTGLVPRYPSTLVDTPVVPVSIPASPWPQITSIMMKELRFMCVNSDGHVSFDTILDFIANGNTIFAVGTQDGNISAELAEAIFDFDSSAKLLFGLPDTGFGIKELRHWADEELIVPVPAHNRSAIGLRFGAYQRPFSFYPSELAHVGLPVASGPDLFAVFDYRDFMAETESMPTGTPAISGVLNRRNQKIKTLIATLATFSNVNDYRRSLGRSAKDLKKALQLGNENQYAKDNRVRLTEAFNTLSAALDCRGERFSVDDFPSYFDNQTVRPFGRFTLTGTTVRTLREIETYDRFDFPLS